MKVKELMTENCICTEPGVSLQAAAELMLDNDCGALPVVENAADRKPLVGMITDRDIVVRAVARGIDSSKSIDPFISKNSVTLAPDQDLREAQQLMSQHKVRRMPVVNEKGEVLGILTAAQLVAQSSEEESGQFIKAVSEKTREASHA